MTHPSLRDRSHLDPFIDIFLPVDRLLEHCREHGDDRTGSRRQAAEGPACAQKDLADRGVGWANSPGSASYPSWRWTVGRESELVSSSDRQLAGIHPKIRHPRNHDSHRNRHGAVRVLAARSGAEVTADSRDMYELFRSQSDAVLYLLCRHGDLEQLPDAVKARGPWNLVRQGDVTRLKREYRIRLERHGFVLEVSRTGLHPEKARGV
jgi:hypothetical protein